MADRCAVCGFPFDAAESRVMRGDGSVLHDETQPISMRRCRDALLAKLRQELAPATPESPTLYRIERWHLELLRAIANRLCDAGVSGSSFGARDAAYDILTVVRFAESLEALSEALSGLGEPHVHTSLRKDPLPVRRKRVYLESPYRADSPEGLRQNLEYLRRCMLDSIARNESPLASHLVYTPFMNDDIPAEREAGIACGLAWAVTAEATVIYTDLGISEGMQQGIEDADAKGRPVVYRKLGAQ